MIELEERLVNRSIWQILQLLNEKGPLFIRDFARKGFKGSPTTLISYVNLLDEHGLVATERRVKRTVRLTEKGEEVLKRMDGLGEIIK